MSKIPQDLRDHLAQRMANPSPANLSIHPAFADQIEADKEAAINDMNNHLKVVPFANGANDVSENAYLDSRIKRAKRICADCKVRDAIETLDALSMRFSALATEMSNIQYADQDRKGNEYQNAADFEERLEKICDDIRSLTGAIDDANIPSMASDLHKPYEQ